MRPRQKELKKTNAFTLIQTKGAGGHGPQAVSVFPPGQAPEDRGATPPRRAAHLSRTVPRLPARCARSRQPWPGTARSSSSLSLRSSGCARRLRGSAPAALRPGSHIARLPPPQRPRAPARAGRCCRPEARAQRSCAEQHGRARCRQRGAAWYGTAGHGAARLSAVQHGAVQHGRACCSTAGHGVSRPDTVCHGAVQHARCRPVGRGAAQHDAARSKGGCCLARGAASRPALRGAPPCLCPGGPRPFGTGRFSLGVREPVENQSAWQKRYRVKPETWPASRTSRKTTHGYTEQDLHFIKQYQEAV